MPGKLGLQPTLEAGLDQLLDQPITAFGLHLPSIDLRVQIIEHTRRLQRSNALTLLTTPLLTLLLINHGHQYLLFNQKHHRLHKQSDTLPRNRRPGEAGVVAQCPDRLVDFPGGDPVDPGLADHRVERLVDPPTWVRQRREERPFSWFRDRQINRPGRRSENCAEQNRRGRPVMGHRGSTFRILGETTGLPR